MVTKSNADLLSGREEELEKFLTREANSLGDERYATQREQDYLLGRVSLARHLLNDFFSETT